MAFKLQLIAESKTPVVMKDERTGQGNLAALFVRRNNLALSELNQVANDSCRYSSQHDKQRNLRILTWISTNISWAPTGYSHMSITAD
jgi:hypothetical protein